LYLITFLEIDNPEAVIL